jgi:uncharacterized repeat protein (TIGR01451 family)
MEGSKVHTSLTAVRGHRLTAIVLVTLLVASLVGVVGSAPADAVEQSATINFESGLSAGDTPSTLSVGHGISGADLGTVGVTGVNPDIAGNAAMIYDATCGGQTVPETDPSFDPSLCSGGDHDLYNPSLGNGLIVTEDGDSSDPDDAANGRTYWVFDYSAWGPGTVTIDSFAVEDVDATQTSARAILYDGGGTAIATIPIAVNGDNQHSIVSVGVSGVASMWVTLNGSGLIDNIAITADSPIIDLELTKTVAPAAVQVDEQTTFTISVVNQGPDDASGVEVTDTLPAGLTYVSDNAGGAYNPATGVWTIGDLAVGASTSMEFVVTVDEAGSFTNEAEVTAANEEDSDSVPGDGQGDDWDQATVTATVTPPPIIDLELTKTVAPAAVQVDEQTTFTISVVNQGPDDASGVEVTDTLPAGLTYVSDNAGGAYNSATGVWTIGDLAVGASTSMEFVVTVDEAGSFTNEAEVTAANEEDSDSVPGDGQGDDWDQATVTASQVQASSTIGDYVWFDANADKVQDATEDGVPNVTVRLTNQATNAVLTQTTNADGKYLFSGLDAGTYLVEVLTSTFPDNYKLTTVGSYTVTVLDDQSYLDADFGIVEVLPVTGMELGTFAMIGMALLGLGAALLGLERRRRRLLTSGV